MTEIVPPSFGVREITTESNIVMGQKYPKRWFVAANSRSGKVARGEAGMGGFMEGMGETAKGNN